MSDRLSRRDFLEGFGKLVIALGLASKGISKPLEDVIESSLTIQPLTRKVKKHFYDGMSPKEVYEYIKSLDIEIQNHQIFDNDNPVIVYFPQVHDHPSPEYMDPEELIASTKTALESQTNIIELLKRTQLPVVHLEGHEEGREVDQTSKRVRLAHETTEDFNKFSTLVERYNEASKKPGYPFEHSLNSAIRETLITMDYIRMVESGSGAFNELINQENVLTLGCEKASDNSRAFEILRRINIIKESLQYVDEFTYGEHNQEFIETAKKHIIDLNNLFDNHSVTRKESIWEEEDRKKLEEIAKSHEAVSNIILSASEENSPLALETKILQYAKKYRRIAQRLIFPSGMKSKDTQLQICSKIQTAVSCADRIREYIRNDLGEMKVYSENGLSFGDLPKKTRGRLEAYMAALNIACPFREESRNYFRNMDKMFSYSAQLEANLDNDTSVARISLGLELFKELELFRQIAKDKRSDVSTQIAVNQTKEKGFNVTGLIYGAAHTEGIEKYCQENQISFITLRTK